MGLVIILVSVAIVRSDIRVGAESETNWLPYFLFYMLSYTLWGFLLCLPALIAFLIIYEVWAWRLTSGLERSTVRIPASELRGGRLSMELVWMQMAPPRWCVAIAYWICAVFVVLGGIMMLAKLDFPTWQGMGRILSFFMFFWWLGILHRERKRQQVSKTTKP